MRLVCAGCSHPTEGAFTWLVFASEYGLDRLRLRVLREMGRQLDSIKARLTFSHKVKESAKQHLAGISLPGEALVELLAPDVAKQPQRQAYC